MSKARIFIAGHKGMVGSSILRLLTEKGQKNLITKSHLELDLTKQSDVVKFFKKKKNRSDLSSCCKSGWYIC